MIKNFAINIISKKINLLSLNVYYGLININNCLYKVCIPLNYWSIEDYTKQWNNGLKKINNEKKSLLIINIQKQKNIELIIGYIFYKKKSFIVINYIQLYGEKLQEILGKNKNFTPENCYKIIPKIKINKNTPRWIVDS